jgi:hypothetical protein
MIIQGLIAWGNSWTAGWRDRVAIHWELDSDLGKGFRDLGYHFSDDALASLGRGSSERQSHN